MFNDVVNRLKSLCSDRLSDKKEDRELAILIGMSSGSFSNAKKREALPHKHIISFATENGYDLNYIYTGQVSSVRSNRIGNIMFGDYNEAYLRYYPDIYATAGNGTGVSADASEETYVMDRRFMPGVEAENVDVITVHGDSMAPTMGDGDRIMIDRSQNEIINNKIYVISFDNQVFVKRIKKMDNPNMLMITSDSDNKDVYPTHIKCAIDVKIIGRVFKVIKKV